MSASAPEQLIIKQLSGNISPEEQEVLSVWLKEKPEHQQAFEDYQKVWALSKPKAAPLDFQTPREWRRLQAELDEVDATAVKGKSLWGSRWGNLKIAASIVFLLGIAALLFVLNQSDEFIIRESAAETIHFTLADGSQVWLNKESSLAYPEDFEGDERLVKLQGEAFFKVAHNSEKPFIVLADGAKVKVLGTSFNVKARPKAPQAEVFVLSGRVSLAAPDAALQPVVLNPGEKGVLLKEKNLLRKSLAKDANLLAWKDHKLVFKKASLEEVVDALEAYFHINIQVANQELLHCRFTGSFDQPELEEVLEVLGHSLNIRIEHSGHKVYHLSGEGCKATEV